MTSLEDSLFSEAIEESYANAINDDTILPTIEIRVPDGEGGFVVTRMVRDYGVVLHEADPDDPDSQEIRGHVLRIEAGAVADAGQDVEFPACMFDFSLPEQADKALPSINITFNNAQRVLAPHLDAAVAAGQPIEVTYREYLLSDPTTVQMMIPKVTMRSVVSNIAQVTGSGEFFDLVNRNFLRTYRGENYPGLAR
jgi:hypothetical protein